MSRSTLLLVVGLTLLSSLLSACGRRTRPVDEGVQTQTLHLACDAEPRDLDPQVQVAFSDMAISLALFEGLTAIEEASSRPVPGQAERWTVSDDGLTWTFHLRPGLQWSDGTPLTAEDFVYSFARVLSPSQAAEYAYVLFSLAGAEDYNAGRRTDFHAVGVRAVDAQTLVLTLAQPQPALASILALPVAFPVPRHVIEPLAARDGGRGARWTRPEHFVSNGPFRLVEWTPQQRIVTERNPRFHDASTTRLSRIIFYPYESAPAQETAFRAGQLHLTTMLPLSKIAAYRQGAQAALLREDPFLQTGFLRFNTTRPPLDDARVRQALAQAIDRTALAERVLLGGQRPAPSLTPPDTAGYTARAGIPHDPEQARALLAEAGFPGGRGFPQLELMTFSAEVNQRLSEALQQMWRTTLGIDISLTAKEQRVWLDDERQLNYDLSSARWIGDYVDPSTFLELFLSAGGNNATGWSDARYDELVRAASRELEPARRHELYQEAEARLLEAAPIAPLYFGTSTYLQHPAVRGWTPALLGFHRYQHVWLEPAP